MFQAFQENAFQNNAFQIGILEGNAFQYDAFQNGAFQLPREITGGGGSIPLDALYYQNIDDEQLIKELLGIVMVALNEVL